MNKTTFKQQLLSFAIITLGAAIFALGFSWFFQPNAIASGGKEGMISMDQALLELYREGVITRETALEYAETPDLIRRQLN